jgi:hypothetical protein
MKLSLIIAIISMIISLFILIYSIKMFKIQTEIGEEIEDDNNIFKTILAKNR